MLIFLGIPLLAGYLTRRIGLRTKGRQWYEERFIPRISPFALYGLLFTIVVLFALQGDAILSDPASVVQIAIPLLAYFALMWGVSFALGHSGAARLCEDGHGRLHRRRQQLRTRHRGEHRGVGRDLGPGADRRDRPADRGPGPGGAGVRLAVVATSFVQPAHGCGRTRVSGDSQPASALDAGVDGRRAIRRAGSSSRRCRATSRRVGACDGAARPPRCRRCARWRAANAR